MASEDGVFFRPLTAHLSGTAKILKFLAHSEQWSQLFKGASSLFAAPPELPTIYDAGREGWVPSGSSPSFVRGLRNGSEHAGAGEGTNDRRLTAAVETLGALVEGLTRRVAELERAVQRRETEGGRVAVATAAEQVAVRKDAEAQDGTLGAVATAARADAEPAGSESEPPRAPEPQDGSSGASAAALRGGQQEVAEIREEPAASASAPPDYAALSLPSAQALGMCLQTLLDSEVQVIEEQDGPSSAELSGAHHCLLRDDDEQIVGAIVVDSSAVSALGGALLMLPEQEIQAQAEAGPTPDTIDAMTEVCNTLTATFNELANNRHVRSGPLEETNPPGWFGKERERACLRLSCGGLLLLLSR